MRQQNFEAKNQAIKDQFLELKRRSPEKLAIASESLVE